MNKIIFTGNIVKGRGGHVELYVPGRDELSVTHPEWPLKLCPGSLNIKVDSTGYPSEFKNRGLAETVKSLDTALFKSAFEIKQNQFGNNKLTPTISIPNRGDAQVWKSILKANNTSISCWVLRRYGSGLAWELEVVSDIKIRDEYGFSVEKEWPCEIELFGEWVNT